MTALAAVPDDAPKRRIRKPAGPKSVLQAVTDDDQMAQLKGMRLRLAGAIDDPTTPARDLAVLTRRVTEISKEIEALGAREKPEGAGAGTPDESFDASAI